VGNAQSIILHGLVIMAIALALVWGNTMARQHEQFSRGEAARARGDAMAAIAGYEAAMHMYTPGSSLVERAAERLWSLGEGFERRGEWEEALIAYRSLRSSCYAVRGLTQPGKAWIERCDTKIAMLRVKENHAH